MLKKTFSHWLGGTKKKPDEGSGGFPWIELNDVNQLQGDWAEGVGNMQIIFKHSTRCGISSMMLRRFEADWKQHATDRNFFLLDLIRYRELSNAVADTYGVHHQSPQVLILKDNTLVAARSHGDISSLTPEGFTT